jgi:hypothetical protein
MFFPLLSSGWLNSGMSTTNKLAYSSATSIACGIDGLANNTSRSSASITNNTNLFLDALVSLQLQITSGTLSTTPAIFVYVYSQSVSGFTDGVVGVDQNYTLPNPTNLKLAQIIPYTGTVGGNPVLSSEFSVASCFGGILPEAWGIVVNNQTGCTLAGNLGQEVNNSAQFIGISITNS